MKKFYNKIRPLLIPTIAVLAIGLFVYGCEPKVQSLNGTIRKVNRAELQLELDNIIATAKIRMADLDHQDQLRGLIVQNALVIAQGQPFSPLGLITAFMAFYGVGQAGTKVTASVKRVVAKKKNGPE